MARLGGVLLSVGFRWDREVGGGGLERKGGLGFSGDGLEAAAYKRERGGRAMGRRATWSSGASIARYGAGRRRVKVAETGSSYRLR